MPSVNKCELKRKHVMLVYLLKELNGGQEVIFNVRRGYELILLYRCKCVIISKWLGNED